MNDALYHEVALAALGCIGGLVRVLLKHNSERTLRMVVASVLLGGTLAATMPAVGAVIVIIVRAAQNPDLSISGGVAIVVGIFGFNIVRSTVQRSEDALEVFGDWLFERIIDPVMARLQKNKNK